VILWHWRDKPGGGVADWYTDPNWADRAMDLLAEYGDPSKEFKLEAL
jgi:hypothetical protein